MKKRAKIFETSKIDSLPFNYNIILKFTTPVKSGEPPFLIKFCSFIPAGSFPSFMKKKKPARSICPSRRRAFFLIRKKQRIFNNDYYETIGFINPFISIILAFKCLNFLYPQALCLTCLIKLFKPSVIPFEYS